MCPEPVVEPDALPDPPPPADPPPPPERAKTGWILARAWCPAAAPLLGNFCYYANNVPYDRGTPAGDAAYKRAWDEEQHRLKVATRALDLTPDVSPDYRVLRSNTTAHMDWLDGADNASSVPIDVLLTPPTVI